MQAEEIDSRTKKELFVDLEYLSNIQALVRLNNTLGNESLGVLSTIAFESIRQRSELNNIQLSDNCLRHNCHKCGHLFQLTAKRKRETRDGMDEVYRCVKCISCGETTFLRAQSKQYMRHRAFVAIESKAEKEERALKKKIGHSTQKFTKPHHKHHKNSSVKQKAKQKMTTSQQIMEKTLKKKQNSKKKKLLKQETKEQKSDLMSFLTGL
ncbi:hypothetical protein PCE1_000735 [Barthelona sp. PCE]